ncbi:MAG: hypothetical protein U0452_15165 [Anaerolineae bacterium]
MDMGDFLSQLPPIFPILMLAFVLLIVGSAAVLIFSSTGGRKKEKKPKSKVAPPPDVPAMKTVTPAPAAAPTTPVAADDWVLPELDQITTSAPVRSSGAYRLTLATGETVEVVEVMVLMRDISDGSLIAQIGGNAYTCPPQGADAEFMRRYAIAARDLSAAAVDAPRGTRSAPTTPPPLPPVADEPAAAVPPPAPNPPAAAKPASVPKPTAAPASPAKSSEVPGDLPKFTSPETTEAPRLGRRPPAAAPVPEINIAASIEAYLQYRLSIDEQFAGRSIHVLPAGADGVRIEVDGQSFQHIDDVTDADVQAFLRDTVSDWQSRQ